jgi:phosphoribosylglycinamide formyltransferase-1
VPAEVVAGFRGRIVNVHPALLPAFGGKGMYGRRVHEAVIAMGCRVTGVTVHQVDERYDEGRPIAQWPVPVLPDDTAETLAARVLRVEHRLYPLALERLALTLNGAQPGPSWAHPEFTLVDDSAEERAMRAALGLEMGDR